MTIELSPLTLETQIRQQFSEIELEVGPNWLMIQPAAALEVFRFVRDDPALDFRYLVGLTSVDRLDYFEVVYHLESMHHNHLAVLKVRVDHDEPSLPSVTQIWHGAHLQEVEVYDLMGIRFEGHPQLRRLFLWEGFAGWPLRKDFLQVDQGAFNPGLPHFPKEGGDRGLLNGPNWSASVAPSGTPGQGGA